MPMEIKRWECDEHPGTEDPRGPWVRYTDHERVVRALEAKLEELEDRIQDDYWASLGNDL